MTYNDSIRRLIKGQRKLGKGIERLKSLEKSASTDDIIRKREDVPGEPYVEIGTHLTSKANLITNGEFEFGFQDWEKKSWGVGDEFDIFIDESSMFHKGLRCLGVMLDGCRSFQVGHSLVEALPGTNDYILTVWVLREFAGGDLYVNLREWTDEGNAFMDREWLVPASTGLSAWGEFTKTFSVANSDSDLFFELIIRGSWSTPATNVWFDSVSLEVAGNLPEVVIEKDFVKIVGAYGLHADGQILGGNFTYTPSLMDGNIVMVNAYGKIDPSWIPTLPHSGLSGLSNDDHPQYLKTSNDGKIKFGNLPTSYYYYYTNSASTDWIKLLLVEVSTGAYRGANFKVEFLHGGDIWGRTVPVADAVYRIRCTRSGSVQDDYDNAAVQGPSTEYCRVMKTATGVYEIQVRCLGTYDASCIKITPVSLSGATFTFGAGTASTVGTEYAVGTPTNFIDHGTCVGLEDNDHPQYLLTTAKAADSDKLDGIDSTGFVQMSGAQTVAGVKTFSSIPELPATNPTTANQAVRKGFADATYLGITAKAADSDKLDGIDSTSFGRPVFLTAPITSAAWDGDAYSTTAKTLIDLSAVFGVPAGVKAILVQVTIRDSGSNAAELAGTVILSPNSTNYSGQYVSVGGLPADYRRWSMLTVPCDANGDIYYQLMASGTGTLDIWLDIWGYWL